MRRAGLQPSDALAGLQLLLGPLLVALALLGTQRFFAKAMGLRY